MKKVNFLRRALIVIFSFMMFNVVVAQQIGTTSIFVVLDSTAVYNRGIPKYGLLFSTETGRLWQANQYTAGTNSLSTTSKTEITSKHAFADSIALLPAQWRSDISDSIVATHPTLAELLEENNDAGDTTITGLRGFGNMSISSGNFGIAHNGGTLKNNSLGFAFNGGSLDESLGVALDGGSLTNNSLGFAFNGGTLDESLGVAFNGGRLTNNSLGVAFNGGSLTNNGLGVAFNDGTLDNSSGFAFNVGSLTNNGSGFAFNGGTLDNSVGVALDGGSLDTSSLGIVFNSTYFKRNTGFSDSYKDSLINGSISSFSGSLNKFENSSQQKGTAKGVLLASDTSNITNSNNFVGINLQNRTYTDKHNTTVIDRNLMLPGISELETDSVLYISGDSIYKGKTIGFNTTELDGQVTITGEQPIYFGTPADNISDFTVNAKSGGIYLNDRSGGGTYIQDFDGGGIYLNDKAGGGIYLNDKAGGGIYLEDIAGGGGIYLDDATGSGIHLQTSLFTLSISTTPPSSATDTGTKGEIRITATHIYVCVDTDTWVRSELTTW